MSDETTEISYANKFKADFMLLTQQMNSKLRMTVRDDPDFLEGKYGYFDRIHSTHSVKSTGRHEPSPLIPTEHSRRRIVRDTFKWGDMVDRKDVRRMMKNPSNRYVQNARAAFQRDVDRTIIAAARGTAYSIDADEAASGVALPSSQKVAVASSGLTLAKLLTTREIIRATELPETEEIFFVINNQQMTNLLNTTEVKSADYNTVKALAEGKVDTFMGFKFIETTLLPKVSTTRYCLAFAKRGLGVALDGEPLTRMSEDASFSYNWRMYMEWELGATRIEDEVVVEVACQETA